MALKSYVITEAKIRSVKCFCSSLSIFFLDEGFVDLLIARQLDYVYVRNLEELHWVHTKNSLGISCLKEANISRRIQLEGIYDIVIFNEQSVNASRSPASLLINFCTVSLIYCVVKHEINRTKTYTQQIFSYTKIRGCLVKTMTNFDLNFILNTEILQQPANRTEVLTID